MVFDIVKNQANSSPAATQLLFEPFSAGAEFRRQNLTSKFRPRTERTKIL